MCTNSQTDYTNGLDEYVGRLQRRLQLCSLDENNKTALIMEMETLIVIKKRCIFIVESVSGSISESLNFLIAISQSVSRVVSQ